VGVPQTTLVLGRHSGRHAVARRCEQLGLTLGRHDLDRVYRQMVSLADRKKHITDDDLADIASAVLGVPVGQQTREAVVAAPQEAGYGFGV
jgi:2-isopropylmalate synthase